MALTNAKTLRLALTVGSLSIIGCNETSKGIDTVNAAPVALSGTQQDAGSGTSRAAGDPGCPSKDQCPPVSGDISANFSATGALVGLVNQPVDWAIHGVDKNTVNADHQSSARVVGVLLDKIPKGAEISPAPGSGPVTADAKITWTPTATASGTMDVILRDMDRCTTHETADVCNQYQFMKAYDTRLAPVSWQVADASGAAGGPAPTAGGSGTAVANNNGTVVKVAGPDCGKNANSNGQVIGAAVLGGATTVLFGLPSVPGLLSEIVKPPPTAKPTQC